MEFCTVINCMDGRVQLPVIQYLQTYFNVPYVDSITEPGPIAALAKEEADPLTDNILTRLKISVETHKSVGLAVVAHYDCAGNPLSKEAQIKQLQASLTFLKKQYSTLSIIGLWLDSEFVVHRIF